MPKNGTFTAAGQTSEEFHSLRPFVATVSGDFVGSVQIEIQTSPNTGTWVAAQDTPRTAPGADNFTPPLHGARFRMRCVSYTSGPIGYDIRG